MSLIPGQLYRVLNSLELGYHSLNKDEILCYITKKFNSVRLNPGNKEEITYMLFFLRKEGLYKIPFLLEMVPKYLVEIIN